MNQPLKDLIQQEAEAKRNELMEICRTNFGKPNDTYFDGIQNGIFHGAEMVIANPQAYGIGYSREQTGKIADAYRAYHDRTIAASTLRFDDLHLIRDELSFETWATTPQGKELLGQGEAQPVTEDKMSALRSICHLYAKWVSFEKGGFSVFTDFETWEKENKEMAQDLITRLWGSAKASQPVNDEWKEGFRRYLLVEFSDNVWKIPDTDFLAGKISRWIEQNVISNTKKI